MQVVRTWTPYTSQVPITVGTTGYKFYTEYALTMPPRNPGDIIIVTANAEVTNPYAFNVQLDSYIGYGLPDSNQDQTAPLTPLSGTNIPPETHHQLVRLTGVIDDALLKHVGLPLSLPANWMLALMMESATTDPRGSGSSLINEGPGNGELVAVIFPAASSPTPTSSPVPSHNPSVTVSGTFTGTIA